MKQPFQPLLSSYRPWRNDFWFALSTIGWFIGGGSAFYLILLWGFVGWFTTLPVPVALGLLGCIVGAPIGIAQTVALKQLLSHAEHWAIATTVSWALALSLSGIMGIYSGILALLGLIIGIFQGLALVQTGEFALWWIIVSTIRWTVGIYVFFSLIGQPGSGPMALIVLIAYGTLTEWVMGWLLNAILVARNRTATREQDTS